MIDALWFAVVLPLIFIVHNIEECVYFDYSVPTLFRVIGGHFYSRRIFIYAISILSSAVAMITALNYFITDQLIHVLMVVIIMSMLINGLQHAVGSLSQRRMLAGSWSAIFFVIPFCSAVLFFERYSILQNVGHALTFLLISVVVMTVSIFICFLMGFGIDWGMRRG